jgi:methionyl-tRNA formyltransferase
MGRLKIVFVGTVEIGRVVLEATIAANAGVDAVFTLPPAAAARTSGYVDMAPLARSCGARLIATADLNGPESLALIRDMTPDLLVVCGWQRLVSKDILDIPGLGAIGFHSSLLPRYRGRAPVNWAMIMGERTTGITMFHLTPEADAGEIIAQREFPILLHDDCSTVYAASARAGAELIREYLPRLADGTAPRLPNPSRSFPAYPKRTPADGLIDFNRSGLDVYNFVRALTRPYPGAFYFDQTGRRVRVWRVEIVFDPSRLRDGDVVLPTLDCPVRLLDYEMEEA